MTNGTGETSYPDSDAEISNMLPPPPDYPIEAQPQNSGPQQLVPEPKGCPHGRSILLKSNETNAGTLHRLVGSTFDLAENLAESFPALAIDSKNTTDSPSASNCKKPFLHARKSESVADRRLRLGEYLLMREHLESEARRCWNHEWEARMAPVVTEWIQKQVTEEEYCGVWRAHAQSRHRGSSLQRFWDLHLRLPLFRARRRISALLDWSVATQRLERDMLASYCDNVGLLIKELEQEYVLEAAMMGQLEVIIFGSFGQKLRIRAPKSGPGLSNKT